MKHIQDANICFETVLRVYTSGYLTEAKKKKSYK